MVRRVILVLLLLLAALILLWIAALSLPEAPSAASGAGRGPDADLGSAYLVVPIAGVTRTALVDSWGDPRDNGLRAHHGIDIPAPAMTPVRAAAPGVVEKLFRSAAGGTTVYIRARQRDWIYYYAHLASYAPGLREGRTVSAGETIGYVGDTGDAGLGNFHLHFGLTRTADSDRWHQGVDVDPYPYLTGKKALR
jgi:murein DD-endopeptidase MepM/ murein hydrolase activator NlpD